MGRKKQQDAGGEGGHVELEVEQFPGTTVLVLASGYIQHNTPSAATRLRREHGLFTKG